MVPMLLIYNCCCPIAQLCLTLCDTVDYSTPGIQVLHHPPELAQTHVHWVSDAIQISHPLSSLYPPVFSLSQHQSIFQWVGSSYQVAKVLELQLQHQSFQCLDRVNFLWYGVVWSLWSPRDSTAQKHQFFSTQLSLWFNSHIHTWQHAKP